MEKQLAIKVFGKVQGVWFRQSTLDKAENLGLKGVVMNESDGCVYIIVRGNVIDLEQFVVYCKIGPPKAEVTNVVIEETELDDFKDFKIIQ